MKETPLEQALANVARPQATPLAVFKLARKLWLNCKRISIGELASAMGVSRVTIYRWVGSREQLIEEILWSFAKPAFENAVKAAPGQGIEQIVETHRRFMTDLAGFEPLRHFLFDHPTEAIRIQTNDPTSAHGRIIRLTENQLIEQETQGHISLLAPAAKIAELIVFTNGALVYSAILGQRETAPAVEHGCTIVRLTLLGNFENPSKSASLKKHAVH